ncbi:hypothetical protein [Kitasatospora sp. NPDC001547]|uniref:hypothetical protein n=1 Tax=Kitasatospora sp. NPDC001547 TaxID=3364015 RepID=UPI00367602EB
MNLRALTRGDAAVAGAAVLLFIASFLPYLTADCSGRFCADASKNAWSTDLFPVLPSIYLLGIVAAVLILVQRFQGQAATNRQVLGLRLDQWGIAFSVAALWTSVWSLGASPYGSSVSHGFGAWLGFIALIVLAGAAAASPLVPALKAPLASDRPAAVPGQYGYPGQPGHPGAPGQYGYPAQSQDPAYGAAQGGYGYPGAGQPQPGQPVQAAQPHDAAAPAAQQAAAPASDFQPFWFAVPAPRQLAPKDNPAGAPVGEVVPGTWYLAVEQRGAALVAQLPDGSQGVLADTTGIQRG